ncbi:hypothetical protein BGAL_0414g00040 [Botrytis galanthina]|uniref:Uncharacterized protein n=1 Tax=Botrytis galanthina TaxID=278940 RepID=A0A4S8QRZ8_9HELO|nr:hypothetical protein BGAL_0414g00040 [Botrytis galanthina]
MLSSTTARFTFPQTLGGHHKIISPNSSSIKKPQDTERCIYVVQEYNCLHHPSLNTPHIFHRTPCPQALLPHASQTDCENSAHREEDELVQVSRYVMGRGCMECKDSARRHRREETVKHPEIHRRMQELGLGQEAIDHFEKVTSSFPTSRRVLELVRARERNERLRRDETRWVLLREEGKVEAQNRVEAKQESKLQSKTDDVEVISPATLASLLEDTIVEGNDSAAPEKEHKMTQRQPLAKEVKIPQPGVILAKKKTPQPSAKFTKLGSHTGSTAPTVVQRDEILQPQPEGPSPTDEANTLQPSIKSTKLESPEAIVAPRVIQRDELLQPQPRGPAAEETTPQLSTTSTELRNPSSNTLPEQEVPITELPSLPLASPIQSANITPPNPTPTPQEASPPSPEKLTDNIHLDLDAEWETDEERERVFGEVALAPSLSGQTGDEWIVVGSWEQ